MEHPILHNTTLQRLSNQHKVINTLIEDLSQDALYERLHPTKWSIQENLAHLGRYQDFFEKRLILILKEKTPKFEKYIAEDDPMHAKWVQLNIEDILAAIDKQRESLLNFISSLSVKKMKRTGAHPKLGKMDIPMWTEFFLLHEAHHIYAIFQLAQRHRNK